MIEEELNFWQFSRDMEPDVCVRITGSRGVPSKQSIVSLAPSCSFLSPRQICGGNHPGFWRVSLITRCVC
jgi:hypothetical protein